MATAPATGLRRVTIVGTETRAAVVLPDQIPLAYLLPDLLRLAGGPPDVTAAPGGWALSRVDGRPLDTALTLTQLGVREDEALAFAARGLAAAEPVFDDVADAVATATNQRPGRWSLAATRRFAAVFAGLALVGAGLVVLLAGPPQRPSGLAGLATGLVLLVAAAVAAWVNRRPAGATMLALPAVGFGGLGGLLLLGGDRPLGRLGAGAVLLGAGTLVAFAVLAAVAAGVARAALLGAALAGLVLAAGATGCLLAGADPATVAAITGTVAFAVVAVLPLTAPRADRPDDPDVVTGRWNRNLTVRGEALRAPVIGAAAAVIAVTGLVVSAAGAPAGPLLAGVLGALALLEVRPVGGWVGRGALLGGGSVALVAALVAGFRVLEPGWRLAVVPGVAVLAGAAAVAFGASSATRPTRAGARRLLVTAELVLILTVLPLVLWVAGVYDWIRTLRG